MTVEELQIIISAKTEGVRAKIDQLKEKIASIQPKKAADVNVTTGRAQGNLKKLQAEIDRTQAKIKKLSAQQDAVQTKIDAREGMYSGVPNLPGMGREETVGTLMDRDPKIQQLTEQMNALDAQTAQLKAHLAETQAQISAAGNAAEPAAAKTRRLGESMRTAGGRIQGAGRSSGYFGRMVKSMLLSMALYSGVSFIMKSVSEGVQNMALGNAQANSTMSQLASSALYLKNSIAAALMPALQALTPVIVQIADGIAWAANQLAIFIAQAAGQETVTIAKKTYVDYAKSLDKTGDSASGANKKVKELQRTIMGFDQLNVLQKNVDSAGKSKSNIPDYGSMFETIKTPASDLHQNLQKMFDTLKDGGDKAQKALIGMKERAREAQAELSKVKLPVLGAWKVPEFPRIKVPNPDLGEYRQGKQEYQQPVKAPTVWPATAPAIILKAFLNSKAQYQAVVNPPAIKVAVAPSIVLKAFLDSKRQYQTTINPPEIKPATAPSIIMSPLSTSLKAAEEKVKVHAKVVSTAFASLGENVMENTKSTLNWGLKSLSTALQNMGKGIQTAFSAVQKYFSETWQKSQGKDSYTLFGQKAYIPSASTALSGVVGGGLISGITKGIPAVLKLLGVTFAARGTGYHRGGPAMVNDQKGSLYKELVQLPDGSSFIPQGRNILFPDLPRGTKILPAPQTQRLIPRYERGTSGFNPKSVAASVIRGIKFPNTFVSDGTYAKSVEKSGSSETSNDVDRIIDRMDKMEKAIENLKINLYTTDRIIAESSNRGNASIDRRYHTIAQT